MQFWQFAKRAQITFGTVAKQKGTGTLWITLHAESTNCMQRRSWFAIPPREHKLEYKKGGEIEKFATIRDSYTQQDLSNHITFRPINSGATVPLNKTEKIELEQHSKKECYYFSCVGNVWTRIRLRILVKQNCWTHRHQTLQSNGNFYTNLQ
jgi:hypothetical protein